MYGKIDILELAKFGNLEFLAKQVVEGFITGLHKSPFHGFSVEFAEHRLYNKGESTKYIDWKLYARTDKLFVKRFEEETNLRCRFVLDASSSMYFPKNESNSNNLNKIGYSVYAIASLIELLKKQREGVGVTIFDDKIITETAIKTSVPHLKRMYAELENIMTGQLESLGRPTKFTDVLHEVAENSPKRSLIILFSDFFSGQSIDELTDAFLHLRHNKHEVILFNVLDKSKELDFEFSNVPTSFVDLETGNKVKLQPNMVKEAYQKRMSSFLSELKLKCVQFKIDFVDVDISESIEFVLQQYLIKRSKMR